MNKKRKSEISKVVEELNSLKSKLENILFEEESYFDNIPENLESSIRAEESEEAIELLTDAETDLESCIDSLSSI